MKTLAKIAYDIGCIVAALCLFAPFLHVAKSFEDDATTITLLLVAASAVVGGLVALARSWSVPPSFAGKRP